MKWTSRSLIYLFTVINHGLLSSSLAFAEDRASGWVVSSALLYKEEVRSRSEEANFDLCLLELRLGYLFANSLFVGG